MEMYGKYNLVDTEEKLRALDKILMNPDGTPKHPKIAYDTETNGLHIVNSTIIGFSISFNKHSGYYIPLLKWEVDPESKYNRTKDKMTFKGAHKKGHLKCVWTGATFDEFVTPKEYDIAKRFPIIPALVERWLSKTDLYMWNAPFDINMTFNNMGVDLTDALLLDGSLLVHVLDENHPLGLKDNAEKYKDYLGIDPHIHAAQQKKEQFQSIIMNGGDRAGQVWRADLEFQSKYACADTFYTYGICERAVQEFKETFGVAGMKWFFIDEVMPVCKEVVIKMKRRGVYIDVPYFEKILSEIQDKMMQLEDQIIEHLESEGLLKGFNIGKSVEEEVSKKALLLKMIEKEGLHVPLKKDPKGGAGKPSLAKSEVNKAYQENPHWLWAHILGEEELKYNAAQIKEIEKSIYYEKLNRGRLEKGMPPKRHRFNISSDAHLRWLFCDKLKMSKKKLPQTDTATSENPIPSMSAEVLEEHMLPKWPWVATLRSYKRLAKLESTYIRPAVLLNVDSWLYMDMKQNGTTSGRFSCSGGYNLQTLPRVDDEMELLDECECGAERFDSEGRETGLIEIIQDIECMANRKCNACGNTKMDIPRPSAIKKGFIAPPGYKIVNADYASLEPRCFAFMSGQQSLKDVYLKGLDLYSQVYCEIFDDKKEYSADPKAPNFLKKVAKAKRNFIKPVVLGIPYGAEDGQVAILTNEWIDVLDKKTGAMVRKPNYARGKEIREAFLSKLSDLRRYMDDQEIKAASQGYVETILGRRRHLINAKTIKDVLDQYGVDVFSLKTAQSHKLKDRVCSFTDASGIKVHLSHEALSEIQFKLKIKTEKLEEKGNWQFIRYLLKSDLNNAKNNPIQGLAGHFANKGMLDSNRRFSENRLDAWVALQIHDELMAYAKDTDSESAAQLLQVSMEENDVSALVDIPMIAEPVICNNLKEAK